MYRCLVQMKQKVTFAGPGRIVIGASTELAIPDIAAARCEGGVFGVRVGVAKVFTEGLGYNAGRHEVDLVVAVEVLVIIFAPLIRRTFHILLHESIKAENRTKWDVAFPNR
jgi:hypothetical protein